MALPLLEDHRDLAEAVAAFANRFGGIADTRSNVKRYAAGDRPDSWMGWSVRACTQCTCLSSTAVTGRVLPNLQW